MKVELIASPGFWAALVFFVALVGDLIIQYFSEERRLGRETARKNLRDNIPMVLFKLSILFFFLLILLTGNYGLTTFLILLAIGLSFWSLTGSLRKREAGALLLTLKSKSEFFFIQGLLAILIIVELTYFLFFLFFKIFHEPDNLELKLFGAIQVICFLIISINIWVLGSRRLEFRENGIWCAYDLIKWQSITSYSWEQSQINNLKIWLKQVLLLLPMFKFRKWKELSPDILRIQFQPPFLSFPIFMQIFIPTKHLDAVSSILEQHVPNKNL
ncbi:MAG: hypothetical protein ICV54_25735 [Nostoc sp. C3-bin3]|nr:hypothetical protein [Nostoc sp. C3-bin3]